jgi:hypothetical protein
LGKSAFAVAIALVAVWGIYVWLCANPGRTFQKLYIKPGGGDSYAARLTSEGVFSALGKDTDALGGVEHDVSSSQTKLHARGREGILLGALGKDTDALVSLQRQALASLTAGSAAGWDALLALSLTKTRFAGRDSIKSDRKKDVMIKVL